MTATKLLVIMLPLIPLGFLGGIWLSWYQHGGLPFWEYLYVSYWPWR